MELLKNLNNQQMEAVSSPARHILVIAGAGSGKTRVLVRRMAWLIQEKGIDPYHIMAVTFTNKAAREMKDRVESLTGINTTWQWIGTFHALCSRFLRIEADNIGIAKDFIIYDTADSNALMKKCLAERGIATDDKNFHYGAVLAQISNAKNKLMTPEDYLAIASDEWMKMIADLYQLYQRRLKEAKAFDFDDLLTQSVWALERCSEVLARYQQRFSNILVDEYQDTNHCQYRLIKLLAGKNGSIFAVGDPDQSIYKWRGADISNILDFARDYPDSVELQLTHNYRSTQNILDAANAVIEHNQARKAKELFTESGEGEKVYYYRAKDGRDEADYVIRTITGRINEGYSLNDCAVLFRTHGQSRLFEDECIRFNIDYRIYGGMKFYERKEVKDTLAYMRLLLNPYDTEALSRIYNEPKRGIGKTTWDKLNGIALVEKKPLWDLLADIKQISELGNGPKTKLGNLCQLISGLIDFAAGHRSIAEIITEIWRASGYNDMINQDEKKADKVEILEQFYDTAADFDRNYQKNSEDNSEMEFDSPLAAFVAQIALATDMDDLDTNDNYLTLMTLHAAKGLEFPIIFLVGMEEGLFPHKRVIYSLEEGEMEEERRLCYVGMTRAKERLYLTNALRRQLWGRYEDTKASRFINEIPEQLMYKYGSMSDYQSINAPEQSTNGSSSLNVFVEVKNSTLAVKPQILIEVGDKVRHAKFGDGVVMKVSGSTDDMLLEVAFPNIGLKKLIWKYAPIKKVN